jgi:uncharacterized membrane protein YfcA
MAICIVEAAHYARRCAGAGRTASRGRYHARRFLRPIARARVDSLLVLIPILLATGCVVGFLAGLFGVGGGMTLVPLLTLVFIRKQFPAEHVVHMAVATSLATILFTSLSSVRAHHTRGAVLWPVVRALAPGLLAGSLVGPQLVSLLSSAMLATVCACFAWFAATQMLIERKPRPARELPGKAAMFAVGGGIGVLASMVGVGGAFLLIPFMTWCNVKIHNAVANSAALTLPVAAAGTIGFVVAGLGRSAMPRFTVGYVYLPALAAIVVASMLVAPVGARVAHSWPVPKLRRAFAAMLYVLGSYMLWQASALWRGA